MTKKILLLILVVITTMQINSQQKRALTVDDLWAMKRIGSFDVSPDGKTIAFEQTAYSFDTNKGNTDIYLVNTDGSNLRAVKKSDKNESEPKFSPDGKLTFSRDDQVWICDLDGGNEKQLTDIYTGASGIVWSKDGSKFLFLSSVYPDCETQDCNKQKDDELEKSKTSGKVFDELLYRHWNAWRGDKRSHLFVFDMNKNEYFDLTLQSPFDVPPIALGSSNDYSISPDGNEAAYTMNTSDFPATSTDNDIFIVSLKELKKGVKPESKKISESKGNDNQPVYSPDGKYIAFCSMERAGFEADKQRLAIYDRESGEIKYISDKLDISFDKLVWSPDSKYIYYDSGNQVNISLYKIDVETGENEMLVEEHCNVELQLTADGNTIFFKQQRTNLPFEIFSADISGKTIKQITEVNEELLAQIEMNQIETFWSDGAEGAKVQSIIVKPPFFDPSKKYPLVYLIHGGPQGKWEDDFHYRWNLQMFAAPGYVVVATNPRGSTGYGQKFTDEISRDWGGKVYTDLMNACDYAINNFDFIDGENTFAAGASYGGYMINWIEGHTDRFNALICHDGVYNLESMYGATEELWFPEWEFGGTPWENHELYEKWSPHRYAKNFKTPMLIVHGANDFRVPENQAFELFTTLQRLGVESKLLYYPDEFHFVVKPNNAKLWWNTIYSWIDEHKAEK